MEENSPSPDVETIDEWSRSHTPEITKWLRAGRVFAWLYVITAILVMLCAFTTVVLYVSFFFIAVSSLQDFFGAATSEAKKSLEPTVQASKPGQPSPSEDRVLPALDSTATATDAAPAGEVLA